MTTNLFIESFEIPEATFPAPIDCNDICLTEKGGAYARDMAANLGAVLTKQLGLYLEKNQAAATPTAAAPTAAASCLVPSSYTMILKNFKVAEATQFVQGLRNNAPAEYILFASLEFTAYAFLEMLSDDCWHTGVGGNTPSGLLHTE